MIGKTAQTASYNGLARRCAASWRGTTLAARSPCWSVPRKTRQLPSVVFRRYARSRPRPARALYATWRATLAGTFDRELVMCYVADPCANEDEIAPQVRLANSKKRTRPTEFH